MADTRQELGESDAPAEDQVNEAFETIVSEGAQRLHRSWREVLTTGLAGGLEVATGVLALFAVYAETRSHLLAGLAFDPTWLGLLLIGLLVAVMYLADHPALFRGYRHQVLTLDRAITDEKELQTELAALLGADIKQFTVQRVDQVRDTTVVDVRYRVRNPAPLARDTATADEALID